MDILSNPMFVTGLMFVWGLLVKRAPFLAGIPNKLIPYMNVLIGIIAKLVAPTPAHAASGTVEAITQGLGWLAVLLQAIFARQLHETFIRPVAASKGTA